MDSASSHEGITVYWRPGCGFCTSLIGQLEHLGVPHHRRNIWEDPTAAEMVRSLARGNETVPTVTVGPAALVNPSPHEVLAVAAEHAPDAIPEGYEPPQPGRFATWITSKLSGTPT